jgi:hypothetical protein
MAIARAVGISNVHAGLLPQDKSALVEQLRREHGPVAMIGDGINDAPALAADSRTAPARWLPKRFSYSRTLMTGLYSLYQVPVRPYLWLPLRACLTTLPVEAGS